MSAAIANASDACERARRLRETIESLPLEEIGDVMRDAYELAGYVVDALDYPSTEDGPTPEQGLALAGLLRRWRALGARVTVEPFDTPNHLGVVLQFRDRDPFYCGVARDGSVDS